MYFLKLLVILLLLIPMQIEARRRIYAGKTPTSTKELPFIVRLRSDDGPAIDGKVAVSCCTGTYIRPLWVITAAHCIHENWPKADHKPLYEINLCMGEVAVRECPNPEHARVANGVYPHTTGPLYAVHDVCLVSIPKPWTLGPTIQIAKLPTQKVDKRTYHNKECMAGGWGNFDDSGEHSPYKNAIVKIYVAKDDDDHRCPVEPEERGKKEQICTLGITGIPCHGDSGGPLYCQGVVIGVLKAVIGNGGACNTTTEKTSYYTLIQEYNDWIVSFAGAGGSRIVPNNLCLSVIYGTLYFFYN